MSSLLQQGLYSNHNLNNISSPSHEKLNVKKKSRKRKNLLNRYEASKRRKPGPSSSRKQVLPSEHDTLSDSLLTERYSISNTTLSSGLNCDLQASHLTPQYDGYPKGVSREKQWNLKGVEHCTDFGLHNRIMACSHPSQLDTAVLLRSSAMLTTKSLVPVYNSGCDRMQDTSERRVLRPRGVHGKETKENLPPLGDLALIVGRRIEVYWPLDAAWYCGLISAFDDVRKKHKVSYDDGEEEWLYLARERFKYEVPSKSEPEQSNGKVKNSEVVKDGKELSALPSSSPNGTSNGSRMPIRKLVAESVTNTSLQADTTVPNVLSPEPTLRTKATDLNLQTKFSLRKHKGNPVGLGKARTVLKGSRKGKGSFVNERTQRGRLKGRPQDNDQKKSEATNRAQSLYGQDLQEVRKMRKRQTPSSKDLCIEVPHNSKKLDGKLETGNVAGAVQAGQPNSRKRKQRLSNDEVSTPRTEGELKCTNSGLVMHCSTGESDKRIRNKQNVKNLAHTALATEDEFRSTVQDTERVPSAEKAMTNATFCSNLSRQNQVLLSGATEPNIGCGDKLPTERTRAKHKTGSLELGLDKRLKRKSKPSRKYIGVHNRGRGRLRRIVSSNRNSSASRPQKQSQGELAAVDRDTHLINTSFDKSFDQEKFSSLPPSFMKAASMNCKCVSGLCTGSVSSVKAAMNRFASECNLSHLPENHGSMLNIRLQQNGSRQSQLRAFFSTIHYSRPDVVTDLFTWQLFNILQSVGLSGGDCFEGRFSWLGSTRDLANIVLLFMFVVKSLPLTSLKSHQCWQGRVLRELWNVLSRKEWSRNLPAALSSQADGLLMQHVRQLISGHSIVNMTSRQMLNIFSSYILKPYIVAVLCEKGAQLRVVMKQYLLSYCPMQNGISFKRQFVRSMELRSHAGPEANFASCLELFPVAAYPCMGAHSSKSLFENSVASVNTFGYAQLPIPIPSFKLSRNQGLQFTTASIFSKKTATHIGHSPLYLEQTSDKFGVECWRLASLLLPREAGDFLLHGRFYCFYAFQKLLDLHTGLCFNSMLQKWLDTTGGRRIISGPIVNKLLIKVDFAAKEAGRVESFGCKQQSHLTPKRTCNDSFDQVGIDHVCFYGSEVMEEGKVYISPSPKRNISVSVKEEYSSPGHARQFDNGATPNLFLGSSPIYSLNDFAYSASGSSSSSSQECNTKWKTTKMAHITSGPHNTTGRKGSSGKSRYMTPEHILLKKRAGSKRRPRGFEQENLGVQHLELSCTANILLSNNTRGWREFGVRVELQSRKTEWVISVQAEGAVYSHKVVESTATSKVNRFTHAMMWKGGDGWTLEFCDRKQWINFKRMHEECGHRNARAAFIKQIPIPCVKQIEESIDGRPSNSSFFGEKWPGEVEYALDCSRRVYDVDSEDEKWLADTSQRNDERVSIDVFERIIDKLERVTYLRQGEMVAQDEVTEICGESMASENAVLSIHHYWSEKRMRKDNALIRYFELPLPKKYQKQLDNWKEKLEKLEHQFPNVTKEELQGQLPQPPLFAFCWPSRGLDADNMSKRLQRQRSQKYLSSLKYARTSSFETSEELLRSQSVHDWHWYQAAQRGDYWQRRIAKDGFSRHLIAGSHLGDTDCSSLHEARATAAAARQSAHLYLLRFDSALQRAVAAIIDFETTYAAELASMSESGTVSSYECLVSLKKRINQVLNQFASLIGKDYLLERNVALDAYSDDDGDDHEEDDPSWTVGLQEDSFENSPFSLNEEGTFLSLSERAHLEAWMRSTLRQRAC